MRFFIKQTSCLFIRYNYKISRLWDRGQEFRGQKILEAGIYIFEDTIRISDARTLELEVSIWVLGAQNLCFRNQNTGLSPIPAVIRPEFSPNALITFIQ